MGRERAFKGRQFTSEVILWRGDFITLAQLGLAVKVVVFNNGTLGIVEMEMKVSDYLGAGTNLKNPTSIRLQPVDDQGGDQRARRRGGRTRPDKPFPIDRAAVGDDCGAHQSRRSLQPR